MTIKVSPLKQRINTIALSRLNTLEPELGKYSVAKQT